VRADPSWSYVQARVQARHGELLAEHDWRSLDAAKSAGHFLERTRATWLRRFTEPLSAAMSSHATERQLRAAWRAYVAEVAEWVAPVWQPAVLWVAVLADLPAIDAVLRGDAPAWLGNDAALAVLAVPEYAAAIEGSRFAPLLPGEGREESVGARWHAHWRTLWPDGPATAGLERLALIVGSHVELLARAGPQARSAPYRQALAQRLVHLFRREGGTALALFAHLGLVALELEQLRGLLVRRRLFAEAAEAA
jgi:hypothetical protein